MFMAVHPWVNLGMLLGPAFHVGELSIDTAIGVKRKNSEEDEVEENLEPPWFIVENVRPLASTCAPPNAPSQAPRYPSLPSISSRSALQRGAMVLWRKSHEKQISVAWPWGYVIEEGRRGGDEQQKNGWSGTLMIIVQGGALPKMLSLLSPLLSSSCKNTGGGESPTLPPPPPPPQMPLPPPPPLLVWDLRGSLSSSRAACAFRSQYWPHIESLCELVSRGVLLVRVLVTDTDWDIVRGGEEKGDGECHHHTGRDIWGCLEVFRCVGGVGGGVSVGKGVLPSPHASLCVMVLGESEKGEGGPRDTMSWERAWDDLLRENFFAAQLLLAL